MELLQDLRCVPPFFSFNAAIMSAITQNTKESIEDKHLSDFCQALGVRCFSAAGLFWGSIGLRVFTHWPPSRQICLSPLDLQYMWEQGAFFVSYFCEDEGVFCASYDVVVEDKNYGYGSIRSAKRRHNIRWALKHCKVEEVSFDLLEQIGLPLVEDTYKRLGIQVNGPVLEKWKNYFRAANSNPMLQAWGAFVSNRLAAFNFHIFCRDSAHIPMTFSCSDLLRWHPVDALVFVSTQRTMARDSVSCISFGRRPLTGVGSDSLLSFKESMGFKKIPLKERLEVNPILKPILGEHICLVIRAISNRYLKRSYNARLLGGIVDMILGQCGNSTMG